MSRPIKIATVTPSVVPVPFLIAQAADFVGIAATNTTGSPYYVKLFWTGQSNLSPANVSAALVSTACTLVPSITIEVPTNGLLSGPTHNSIVQAGNFYLWAVSTAADASNTSLASGGDAITVFID